MTAPECTGRRMATLTSHHQYIFFCSYLEGNQECPGVVHNQASRCHEGRWQDEAGNIQAV